MPGLLQGGAQLASSSSVSVDSREPDLSPAAHEWYSEGDQEHGCHGASGSSLTVIISPKAAACKRSEALEAWALLDGGSGGSGEEQGQWADEPACH